jgi:hypothetical protein
MPLPQQLRNRKHKAFGSDQRRKDFLGDIDNDIVTVSKKAERIGMVPLFGSMDERYRLYTKALLA